MLDFFLIKYFHRYFYFWCRQYRCRGKPSRYKKYLY